MTTPQEAIARIVERADLIGHHPDGSAFLLVTVNDELLEWLSAFGADTEDMEEDDDSGEKWEIVARAFEGMEST